MDAAMPEKRHIVSELKYVRHPSSVDYDGAFPTTDSSGNKGIYLVSEGQSGSAIYKSPRFSWPDDAPADATGCLSFQAYMGGTREEELELFSLSPQKGNVRLFQQKVFLPKLVEHVSQTVFKEKQWGPVCMV